MSSGSLSLGPLKDPIESRHFPFSIAFLKYGLSIREDLPKHGRSLDFMVYLEREKQKSFRNIDVEPTDTVNLAEYEFHVRSYYNYKTVSENRDGLSRSISFPLIF